MGSILDSILNGEYPDLEALRHAAQDGSTAARQRSIDNSSRALDQIVESIEGDDIDARTLRLLIEGAKFINRASHEDILNAATDGPDNLPQLSVPVRMLVSRLMKEVMEVMGEIDMLASTRQLAVEGFKESMKVPSYVEQREQRATDPLLTIGTRVDYCGQGESGGPGTVRAISMRQIEARDSIMDPPVYRVEWDDTLPDEDGSGDWYVAAELRVLAPPAA